MTAPPRNSRRSTRLRGFDHASNGAYVITVCSHQRRPVFGRIVDGAMCPTDLGRLVEEEWHQYRAYIAQNVAKWELDRYCESDELGS